MKVSSCRTIWNCRTTIRSVLILGGMVLFSLSTTDLQAGLITIDACDFDIVKLPHREASATGPSSMFLQITSVNQVSLHDILQQQLLLAMTQSSSSTQPRNSSEVRFSASAVLSDSVMLINPALARKLPGSCALASRMLIKGIFRPPPTEQVVGVHRNNIILNSLTSGRRCDSN